MSYLLITTLLSVFATGILMLLVFTERNRLQIILAAILGVFFVMMLVGLINMAQSREHIHAVLASPLRFRFLALGLIAFFATMTYYMVAAHRNPFTIRNGILFLSPVLLTLVVYAVWHWGTGTPMDYSYASLAEVWEKRFTVPVILRVLLYLFFLVYQGVMIYNMWYLDSLRSKYSILNSPDAVSTIRWLRMVVVGIMAVVAAYSLLVFIPSVPVLLLYTVVTVFVFIYFIYNAIARRMYEDTEGWQATWIPREGWKVVEGKSEAEQPEPVKPLEFIRPPEPVETSDAPPKEEANPLLLIDRWMKKEKPFCRAEFSAAEIICQFPGLERGVLTEMLQKRNEQTQSYIRRYRIEEACRIICREKAVKVSELALSVGFSHPTSFSRAFAAVMGETVVQYMDKVGAKRKPNNKLSNSDTNNIKNGAQ